MRSKYLDRLREHQNKQEQNESVCEPQQAAPDSSLRSWLYSAASDLIPDLTATPASASDGSREASRGASAAPIKDNAMDGQQVLATTLSDIQQDVRVNERLLRDLTESLKMWVHQLKGASIETLNQISALPEKTAERMGTSMAHSIDSRMTRMENQISALSEKTSERMDTSLAQSLDSRMTRMEQSMNQELTRFRINLSMAMQQRLESPSRMLQKEGVAHVHATGVMVEEDIAEEGIAEERIGEQNIAAQSVATRTCIQLPVGVPVEAISSNFQPVGIRVQKTRLARHMRKLIKAEHSNNTYTMIRKLLRKSLRKFFKGDTGFDTSSATVVGLPNTMDGLDRSSRQIAAVRAGVAALGGKWAALGGKCLGRSHVLERMVESRCFYWGSVVLITLNVIWIAMSNNHKMKESVQGNHTVPDALVWGDRIFVGAFAIEVVLRIAAYRCTFFLRLDWRYNLFDLVVVVMGLLANVLSLGFDASMLRVVRVLRLMRVFKVVRSLAAFTELQHLLCAVIYCGRTLFWTSSLLFIVSLMCAITCMEILLTLDENDNSVIATKATWFSSLRVSLDTVMMIASFGVPWRDVVAPLGGLLFWVILLYVMFLMLLFIPIVIGTHAMRVANFQMYEPYVCIQRKMQDAEAFIDGLEARIRAQGHCMGDRVSRETLAHIMEDPETEKYLLVHELGFEVSDVFELFDLDNASKITLEQFVYGCHFLTAASSATDTFFIGEQISRVEELICKTVDRLKALERFLGHRQS